MSGQETTAGGEWTAWRNAWVEEAPGRPEPATAAREAPAVADLLRRLHRQRRRMLVVAASEVLLMLLLIAASVAVLHGGLVAWKVVWVVTLWVFACVAFAFAWWNRRAIWGAAGATVDDAVRLARLRAERQLRTARFVLLLYAVETAAVLAQLAWFGRLVPAAVVALAAGGAVVAAWSAYTRGRLRRELARIDDFVRDTLGPR